MKPITVIPKEKRTRKKNQKLLGSNLAGNKGGERGGCITVEMNRRRNSWNIPCRTLEETKKTLKLALQRKGATQKWDLFT